MQIRRSRMRRTSIYLMLLVSGVVSYAAVTITSLLLRNSQQNPGSMMGMGGMMKGIWPSLSLNPYSTFLSIVAIIGIVLALVGAVGLFYTMIKPESGIGAPIQLPLSGVVNTPAIGQLDKAPTSPQLERINTALKMLKPDELRIVNILRENDGKYLQKWITKDSGMSRLQTHRVLVKLSERKIVTLQKTGNTNEVALADWLREENASESL